MPLTVIKYYGKQNNSRCGYCKGTKSSHSHGMHAYVMSPQDYQDLIDRGWRRSGHYCYKPNNKITCCPSYTIRCNAPEFKLSKSHKKILKRMNKFVTDGIKDKQINEEKLVSENPVEDDETEDTNVACGIKEEPDIPNVPIRDVNINEISKSKGDEKVKVNNDDITPSTSSKLKLQEGNDVHDDKGDGPDDSRPPRKKAKQMRLERKQQKLAAKGISLNEELEKKKSKYKNQEKSLREYINSVPENSRHILKVTLVPSNKEVTAGEIELYRKYQMGVHHDPPQKLTQAQFERFLVKSPLKLKLVEVNSEEFKATLNESYGLYQKYQTTIHNDPPDGIEDFLFFLVRSPVKPEKRADGPPQGYGSFHQQYWLDDKLIAVGVIDILPYCVSSVYFFYDPDYSFLSLGTYGSLREIDFIQQLYEKIPSMKYYYMGFYIHSCPKMRYKGKLIPSYLLCPEVYSWHLLTDEIRNKLNESKYQRFNDNPDAQDLNEFTDDDINSVLISMDGRSCMRFGDYLQSCRKNRFKQIRNIFHDTMSKILGNDAAHDDIKEYGILVGKACAKRIIFIQ